MGETPPLPLSHTHTHTHRAEPGLFYRSTPEPAELNKPGLFLLNGSCSTLESWSRLNEKLLASVVLNCPQTLPQQRACVKKVQLDSAKISP